MEQQQQQRGAGRSTAGRCAAGLPTAMRLSITSTTGSPVELTVPRGETVEGLRTRISQRLRLPTDRIVLLHKDRQLTAGKLLHLGVADGSRLILVPVVEAGLMCSTARAERTVMDVLESLTDVQISDFLSGRSPLTINLGLGAHMMYVQLQLSEQDVMELQQVSKAHSSRQQSCLPTEVSMSPSGSTRGDSTTSATSPLAHSTDSTSLMQLSTQRPATVPAVNCRHYSSLRHSCPPCSTHTSASLPPTHSLPSGCPHPSCPLPATTAVCPPDPSPGPPSPVPGSTFQETNVHSSTADACKQPGAVIESFVSHSPGVFSGTFSGRLAPCSQSSISHPRHGIAIILQILNDLIVAASRHQGAPPTQPHRPAPDPQRAEPLRKPPAEEARSCSGSSGSSSGSSGSSGSSSSSLSSTEENRMLHCKLEHLHCLLDQRRLRRRTRRGSHLPQTSHPYQRCRHRP